MHTGGTSHTLFSAAAAIHDCYAEQKRAERLANRVLVIDVHYYIELFFNLLMQLICQLQESI